MARGRAGVRGELVRCPVASCSILNTAPSTFVQHARNPERSSRSPPETPFLPPHMARRPCATSRAAADMERSSISRIS